MLVLTRKLNESIVIDGNISVTVVSVRGNQVRLGITAPQSLGIYRSELTNRAARKNRAESTPDEAVMEAAVS